MGGSISKHFRSVLRPLSISVILNDSRSFLGSLALSSSDIAHHPLLTGTHCPVTAESWNAALSVETFDLKLTKFHVKIGDEIFEDVTGLGHKLGRNFLGQDLFDILVWPLKVREKQNEYFLWIARYFDKIDCVTDLMEISIKYLSRHLNSIVIKAYIHGRGAFFGHNIDLVGSIDTAFLRRSLMISRVGSQLIGLVTAICGCSIWHNWLKLLIWTQSTFFVPR